MFGPLDLKAPDYSFKKASKETIKVQNTAVFQNSVRNTQDKDPTNQQTGQSLLQDKIKAIDDKIS